MVTNVGRTALVILLWPILLPTGCTDQARKTSLDGSAEGAQIVEQHWPGGRLRLRKEVLRNPDGTVVDHGRYTRWHENGAKEYETTFVRGKKHGTATRWHMNGRKWIEEHYLNGKRHGAGCSWDASGRKRKEEHHLNGRPHGTWTVWNAAGKVKSRQHFDAGTPKP
ncbi:MAG: hypothetical protein V3S01_09905 [Dehalococcoidia bacterium]